MTDRLDPEMAAILAAAPVLESLDIVSMRRHALASKAKWNDGACEGLDLSRGRDDASLRIASAAARGASVVHLHGGGWSICSPDTHLSILAELARATERPVLAPHPRQAPEHPFPAPLDDVLAALRDFGNRPYVLSGDSAGANLALAAVLRARAMGLDLPVSGLVLFYGCYRRTFDTPSHVRFGEGYGLTTHKMRMFWEVYAPDGGEYADLEQANFAGLPRIQLHLAECDPLADDTRWLHARLCEDGVESELVEWRGMAHGFLHYSRALPQARAAFRQTARFVGEVL